MIQVGDKHNFGRTVTYDQGWYFKPRSVFWEKQFLDRKSELRIFLRMTLPSKLQIESLLPDLRVFADNTGLSGRVQELKIAHGLNAINPQEAFSIGSLVGILFWLGVGDLHSGNLITGRTHDGRLVVAPIDIECIFENHISLQKSLLLPGEYISRNKCGLGKILETLTKDGLNLKIELLKGLIQTVSFLNSNSTQVLSSILMVPGFKESRIRVIVRSTSEYLSNNSYKPFLYSSEKEQLERGDIPYYFKNPLNETIYYFKHPEIHVSADFTFADLPQSRYVNFGSDQLLHKKLRATILSLFQLAKELGILSLTEFGLEQFAFSDGNYSLHANLKSLDGAHD